MKSLRDLKVEGIKDNDGQARGTWCSFVSLLPLALGTAVNNVDPYIIPKSWRGVTIGHRWRFELLGAFPLPVPNTGDWA
jgi:hypothetical protein